MQQTCSRPCEERENSEFGRKQHNKGSQEYLKQQTTEDNFILALKVPGNFTFLTNLVPQADPAKEKLKWKNP